VPAELVPADEVEPDSMLLSKDDVRELLMLPIEDMGFLLYLCMLSDAPGIT
jgi:hypothetical protein